VTKDNRNLNFESIQIAGWSRASSTQATRNGGATKSQCQRTATHTPQITPPAAGRVQYNSCILYCIYNYVQRNYYQPENRNSTTKAQGHQGGMPTLHPTGDADGAPRQNG